MTKYPSSHYWLCCFLQLYCSSIHRFSRQEYWSGVPLPSPTHSLELAKSQFKYFLLNILTG